MTELSRRGLLGSAAIGAALLSVPKVALADASPGHVAYVSDMPWYDPSGAAPRSHLPSHPAREYAAHPRDVTRGTRQRRLAPIYEAARS